MQLGAEDDQAILCCWYRRHQEGTFALVKRGLLHVDSISTGVQSPSEVQPSSTSTGTTLECLRSTCSHTWCGIKRTQKRHCSSSRAIESTASSTTIRWYDGTDLPTEVAGFITSSIRSCQSRLPAVPRWTVGRSVETNPTRHS